MDQLCCPAGGLWVVSGWSPDFLAKSLVVTAIYMKFKLIDHKFNVYMAGITSDLASWWSLDDFRRDNIAGPHGILEKGKVDLKWQYFNFIPSEELCFRTIYCFDTLCISPAGWSKERVIKMKIQFHPFFEQRSHMRNWNLIPHKAVTLQRNQRRTPISMRFFFDDNKTFWN